MTHLIAWVSGPVSGCFRSSGYFDIWQKFEYPRLCEQRLLRYLAKVRVLELRVGGGGAQTGDSAAGPLFFIWGTGGTAVPRPHHSLEHRDNPRPGLEYRGSPITSPFTPTNQGGAGQTQEKQSPPGHGR
jgi:hypothetical protein